MFWLAAQILWRIEREGGGLTEGSLVSIDELQNHVEHFGEEEKKELRIDLESFLEFWPPNSKQFGMQYISHILGVINCNGFTLSDQRGLQAVGVGIFPNLCMVNHDCWPSCSVIFNNGKNAMVNESSDKDTEHKQSKSSTDNTARQVLEFDILPTQALNLLACEDGYGGILN
ncbi:UNVERIFIED_CONTAM: Histone-lysine N-methyltransferase smyd1 [Gekko kuhli]